MTFSSDLSPLSLHELAEEKRRNLARWFPKHRKQKGEHIDKASIVIAYQNINRFEHYFFGSPSVLPARIIRAICIPGTKNYGKR